MSASTVTSRTTSISCWFVVIRVILL